MKYKYINIIIALFVLLFCTSCVSQAGEGNSEINSGATSSTSDSAQPMNNDNVQNQDKTSNSITDPIIMKEIERLAEGDKKCFFEIFVLFPGLPTNPDIRVDNRYYKVESDEFKKFSDLENYTRNIFCDKEANRLLFGDYDDMKVDPLYFDIDGDLYQDRGQMGGMGYYSTWPDYWLEITSMTDDVCEFKLHTTEDPPPEDGDPITLVLNFKAIKENGQLKLEEMVY